MIVGASESVLRRHSLLATVTGTVAFFSPWRCLRFSSWTVYHGVTRLWRFLSFFVDVSIHSFSSAQSVDRCACGVVRTDRVWSGSSDRSSIWQCPDLRVQALPHRRETPFRECFAEVHGVVSSTVVDLELLPHWYRSHRADVPICGPWANTTSEPRRSFSVPAHTLHEQVGDLVLKGDASSTTKVYLEALGLPIAFHGTSIPAPTWVQLASTPGLCVASLFTKRRCYFRCENSRQSILHVWTSVKTTKYASVSLVSWQCFLCARR